MSREPKQRQLAWQDLDGAAHVLRHPGFRILAQVGSLKHSKHKYDINKYKRVSFSVPCLQAVFLERKET